jgi:tRNA U38,U39,U40 pseudouridine synthase TruA
VSTICADVNQVSRPSPDKTLRVIKVEGGQFLIPSTRAMAYILHNNCAKAHSVAQIREVLKCQRDKSNINRQQLTLP